MRAAGRCSVPADDVTVAVRVTDCPYTVEPSDDTTAVLEPAFVIVRFAVLYVIR
jgi:hypothetical protein